MTINMRINFKFILLLLVGVAVVAGGTHALHALQLKRIAGNLLTGADKAEETGKRRKAEESLKDYLHFNPDDRVALSRYGIMLASSARSAVEKGRATEVLERVVKLDPEDVRARRALADFLMEEGSNRLEDARGHLEILLEASPKDGEIEARLAQCLEQAERYKEASQHYASSIKLAPTRLDSYVRYAQMLRSHLDNSGEADRVMDAKATKDGIVASNPNASRAFLERAAYRREYKFQGVAEDAKTAFKFAPDDADAILMVSQVEAVSGDRDAARSHLESGLKLHPDDGRMYESLANVELASGRPKEAEAFLRRGIDTLKKVEDRVRLLWSLGNSLIKAGQISEVRAVIGRLKDEKIRPEFADYLEAQVLASEQKWLEAALLLEEIYPRIAERREIAYQANLLLGLCYEQNGDLDRRQAVFRRAVAIDPLTFSAKVGLANTLAEMGQLDEAIALHGQMVDSNPRSKVDLARLSIIREIRRPEAKRNWQETDRVLASAAQVAPDAPEVTILRAEALTARGRREEAGTLIRKARDARPDRVELWIASAEFEARFGNPEVALQVLTEAKAKLGDRTEFRLAVARYWSERKGPESSKALIALGENLDSLPPAERVRLLRGLVDAHERVGDPNGAARVIVELVRLQPRDLGLRVTMFDAAIAGGDEESAGRMVDDMKAIEGPEGTFWRFGKANLLITKARRTAKDKSLDREALREAKALLDQVADRRPSWSRPFEARGDVNLLTNRPDAALKDFLQAIELGERSPGASRKAVQLLYDMKRYDQADSLLRKLTDRGGNFEDSATQKLVAQISLQTKNPTRALDIAKRSVSTNSLDPAEHAWLGQILLAAGKFDEAEAELRRSIALGPKIASTYVTLIRCLTASGRKERADKAITEANAAIPGGLPPLSIATCFAMLGRLDEAHTRYRDALKQSPDDLATLRAAASFGLAAGWPDEAQSDLRHIISLSSKSPQDAAWSRRLLAVILAGSSDPKKKIEALRILGLTDGSAQTESSGEEPIEEIRAQARVLASQGDRSGREAAIRLLEQIARRDALTIEDRFLQARLSKKSGAWPQYRTQMLTLLADESPNPVILEDYARSLLRRGDAKEARRWVEKLEVNEKGSGRAIELRARLLHSEGRMDEADKLILGFADGADNRILPAAALLEEIGRPSSAELLYDRFAERSKQPQAVLVKASFLGRQGRLASALDLCEKAMKTCQPEDVALTAVAIIYAAPLDVSQDERAARIVEAAARGKAESAASLYYLANVRSHQGRAPEAEALYRRSLAIDPQNTGPMNNLAWLLARTGKDLNEAVTLIDRALAITGPVPDVLDTRGVVRIAQDRAEDATRDLEDAISDNDLPPVATLVHLAEARLLAQDLKAVEDTLRKIASARPGPAILHPLDSSSLERVRLELARKSNPAP